MLLKVIDQKGKPKFFTPAQIEQLGKTLKTQATTIERLTAEKADLQEKLAVAANTIEARNLALENLKNKQGSALIGDYLQQTQETSLLDEKKKISKVTKQLTKKKNQLEDVTKQIESLQRKILQTPDKRGITQQIGELTKKKSWLEADITPLEEQLAKVQQDKQNLEVKLHLEDITAIVFDCLPKSIVFSHRIANMLALSFSRLAEKNGTEKVWTLCRIFLSDLHNCTTMPTLQDTLEGWLLTFIGNNIINLQQRDQQLWVTSTEHESEAWTKPALPERIYIERMIHTILKAYVNYEDQQQEQVIINELRHHYENNPGIVTTLRNELIIPLLEKGANFETRKTILDKAWKVLNLESTYLQTNIHQTTTVVWIRHNTHHTLTRLARMVNEFSTIKEKKLKEFIHGFADNTTFIERFKNVRQTKSLEITSNYLNTMTPQELEQNHQAYADYCETLKPLPFFKKPSLGMNLLIAAGTTIGSTLVSIWVGLSYLPSVLYLGFNVGLPVAYGFGLGFVGLTLLVTSIIMYALFIRQPRLSQKAYVLEKNIMALYLQSLAPKNLPSSSQEQPFWKYFFEKVQGEDKTWLAIIYGIYKKHGNLGIAQHWYHEPDLLYILLESMINGQAIHSGLKGDFKTIRQHLLAFIILKQLQQTNPAEAQKISKKLFRLYGLKNLGEL